MITERNTLILNLLQLPEPSPEEPLSQQGKLREGYTKHYKGNHRSTNRGVGFKALIRNNWMKNNH